MTKDERFDEFDPADPRLATAAGPRRLRDDPLLRQWLLGELPFTLASLLPEIAVCRGLQSKAGKVLASGLADLLDADIQGTVDIDRATGHR